MWAFIVLQTDDVSVCRTVCPKDDICFGLNTLGKVAFIYIPV